MRNLLALAERLALVSLGARRSGRRRTRAAEAVGFSPPCVTLGGLPSGEGARVATRGELPEEGGMSGQARARVLCCTMLIYCCNGLGTQR